MARTNTNAGGTPGTVTGSGAATQIAYWDTATSISGDNDLWFDPVTTRLGVGTNNPLFTGDFVGTINTSTQYNIGGLFFGDQDQGNLSVSVGNNAHNVALGLRNTVFGIDAANNLTIGNDNTVIGQNAAGDAAWASNQNTIVGSGAARLLSVGAGNTIMGYGAGDAISAGNDNVIIGAQAAFLTSIGSDIIAIGSGALASNISGSSVVAIGSGALSSATANSLVAIGGAAGLANVSGAQNTYLGFGTNSVLGTDNNLLAVGYTATAANRGTAIGSQTSAGDSGIALGHTASAAPNEFALPLAISNWKFQNDSYVLPVNGSITTAGALTNDGVGNLTWVPAGGGTVTGTGALGQATFWTGASVIAGSSDFLWNNTTKEFSVGDLGSGANSTTFVLDDPNSQISFGSFINVGAANAVFDTSTHTANINFNIVNLGDTNSSGNDTVLSVDDTAETVRVTVDNLFGVRGTNLNGWFEVSPTNRYAFMGDLSGLNNNTSIQLDDVARTIISSTQQAGVGGRAGVSATSAGVEYSDGVGTWSWFADDTAGGTAQVQSGSTIWAWPQVDSTGTQALTSNGSGVLGWTTLPTGTVTGSGTAPRVPYWNSATALIDDAAFTRMVNRGLKVMDAAARQNVFIGDLPGNIGISGTQNIAIGPNPGQSLTSGSDNILLGNNAGFNVQSGQRNIYIGEGAGFVTTTGSDNMAFGGQSAGPTTAGTSETIAFNGNPTASRQIVFGQDTGVEYRDLYAPIGVNGSMGSPINFTIHGTSSSGFTNQAASSVIIASGQSSGTATPANVLLQTTNSIASGTTAQTLTTVAQTQGQEDYMAFRVNHGLINDVTVLNDANYDASTSANLQAATPTYIFPTLSAGRGFTLPDISDVAWGTEITVMDGKGSAGAFNITITASGTDTIVGAATYVMNQNYQSVTLVAWGDIGANYWSIK